MFGKRMPGANRHSVSIIIVLQPSPVPKDVLDLKGKVAIVRGAGWTPQATVEPVTDSTTLTIANDGISTFASSYFECAVTIWQSGPKAGVAREVLA